MCVVGMMAKWSETFALLKMRLFGLHPAVVEHLARRTGRSGVPPSICSVALTVPR